MVRAELITKSGTKVSIEGPSEEVGELLEDIERRERRAEERKLFFERMRTQYKGNSIQRNRIVHGREIKLTDVLESFIKNGFFDEGKRIGEVMFKLEQEGISAPPSTIHPLLSRLVAKQSLKRQKGESGTWEYKKK